MKKVIILVCALTIMSISLAACNTSENSTPAASLLFTVSGSYFELSGDNAIYSPNVAYEFNLNIRNDIEEEWKGNCYVFLIDNNGPLMDISDIEINLLNKGDQESTVVSLVLPENIKPGAYGLALLFPEKGHLIKTIYIGESIPHAGTIGYSPSTWCKKGLKMKAIVWSLTESNKNSERGHNGQREKDKAS